MNTEEYILVRSVNWIGDAVMSLPVVRSIRKLHPRSRIFVLVKKSVSDIYRWETSVDEIITYPKGLLEKLDVILSLKKLNFKRVYLLQNAFEAALVSFLAGIPERIGYGRDFRSFLLTHPIKYNGEDRKRHQREYFLEIVRSIDPSIGDSLPFLNPSIEDRKAARTILKDLRRPILAVAAGASYGPAKKWPSENFVEVMSNYTKMYGSVILLGTWGDGPQRGNLADVVDFTGKTEVWQMVSLIAESDLLLCNDSGPMHVGYAVGTPLVAIFGSTSPELTGPPLNTGRVLYSRVRCAPCFKRSCSVLDCMKEITVSDVWRAVEEVTPRRKAVFFDRDGTLCKDAHYLSKWEDFEVMPDLTAVERLKKAGFLLIGVTNQSGIARGIVEESFVKAVNDFFKERYGFDDFFYCPHLPEEGCFCRKPSPGLAIMARHKFNIDFKSSFVVGDKASDGLLAEAIGATGVILGKDVKNLKEAVDLILDKEK